MSRISRLIGMASRAIDKNGSSARDPRPSDGGDWRDMVRGAADALTGDARQPRAPAPAPAPAASAQPPRATGPGLTPPPPASMIAPEDKAAIARYDYLLQTADPQRIEQIHREAFERLTPDQRNHIQQRMSTELAPHERPASSSAPDLARAAARTEAAAPGRLRGILSRVGRGGAIAGVGGAAVGILGAVAGGAILSAAAGPLLEQAAGLGVDFDALAEGVDLEGVADGVLGGAAEQVSGLGEQLSGFEIPGLGDIFGR